MLHFIQNLLAFLTNYWESVIVVLILEAMSFLPAKWNGILKVIVSIGNAIFKKKPYTNGEKTGFTNFQRKM